MKNRKPRPFYDLTRKEARRVAEIEGFEHIQTVDIYKTFLHVWFFEQNDICSSTIRIDSLSESTRHYLNLIDVDFRYAYYPAPEVRGNNLLPWVFIRNSFVFMEGHSKSEIIRRLPGAYARLLYFRLMDFKHWAKW